MSSYISKYADRENLYCSWEAGCDKLAEEIDHVVPRALGGSLERSNERPLCKEHHTERHKADGMYRLGGLYRSTDVWQWMHALLQFQLMKAEEPERWQAFYEYYTGQRTVKPDIRGRV